VTKVKTTLNDELRIYLKEIAQRKVLTREEEVALFKRLNSGDESARAEIVEANLRFVIKVALSFASRGVALADLVQEGNIGLLEVVDKFDYRRGYRFSTYAAFWIRQSIQLALRKQSNVIRLPIRKSRFLGHLNESMREFAQNHGRQPSVRELALILDVEETKLEQLLQLRDSVLSLDIEADEEGAHLLNTLKDENTPSPLDHCLEAEKRHRVETLLNSLSEKEQKILKLRYGFQNGKNLSLRSTSKLVGMSQEGVRRVERKALTKLRRPNARQSVCGLI
jgi:RNA polymerase primary sigma factor